MLIIRNIHYFNATTCCFPGTTVPTLLNKLPGHNDTVRRESEWTKDNFNQLFKLLKSYGKSVFISGPLPTLSHDSERFSRLLSLNTWLQSTCHTHDFGFIDNFNLFWNRRSFYRPDGIHPNRLGCSFLAVNLQLAVQSAPPA
uniref:SGNH hydrolase-type esterase domain-containing protein n=1 Tax=Scophthalmus maximus TaxID=52904 RepID=A0A8D3C3S3_SCOMX